MNVIFQGYLFFSLNFHRDKTCLLGKCFVQTILRQTLRVFLKLFQPTSHILNSKACYFNTMSQKLM